MSTSRSKLNAQLKGLLERGLAAHRSRNWHLAQQLYREILNVEEDHFDALQLLAIIESELGKYEDALALYDKALKVNRNSPSVLNNRGNTLRALKQFDRAIVSYREAISIAPTYANAHNNLGSTFLDIGRLDEAIKSYTRALEIQPTYANALSNRGVAHHKRHCFEDALNDFARAIECDPNSANTFFNQSLTLKAMGKLNEALRSINQAISIKPNYPEAFNNRGVVFKELNRFDEAHSDYMSAIKLRPHYAEPYNNLGNLYRATNRPEEALACFDKAIELNPDYSEALYNKGNALRLLKRNDAAVEYYNRAIRLDSEHVNSHWNKSLLLLLSGDYEAGWQEYEWRIKRNELKSNYYTGPERSWRGDFDISDKTLLIYGEQGFGDTLQFARYLPMVRARAGEVIFQVPYALARLMQRSYPWLKVVAAGDKLPPFDCHCPLMSLPLVFKTTIDSIPSETPYLVSDPSLDEIWKQRISMSHHRPSIGLCWNGGFRPEQPELWETNNRRNIAIREFSKFLQHSECAFFSLQKGEPAESELRGHENAFWPNGNFYNFADELADFTHTAALVCNLDLVICVDTSTAHLSAALGRPTWILNRFDGCWRWLENRNDSPWYPTVRLFRQDVIGNWTTVLDNVRTELANFIKRLPK